MKASVAPSDLSISHITTDKFNTFPKRIFGKAITSQYTIRAPSKTVLEGF